VVLASKKKIDFIRQAESAAADDPDSEDLPSFELLVRDKVDDSCFWYICSYRVLYFFGFYVVCPAENLATKPRGFSFLAFPFIVIKR